MDVGKYSSKKTYRPGYHSILMGDIRLLANKISLERSGGHAVCSIRYFTETAAGAHSGLKCLSPRGKTIRAEKEQWQKQRGITELVNNGVILDMSL